jgi:hypothetical protein
MERCKIIKSKETKGGERVTRKAVEDEGNISLTPLLYETYPLISRTNFGCRRMLPIHPMLSLSSEGQDHNRLK